MQQLHLYLANNGNASTQNVPVYVVFYDNDLAYFTTTDIVLSSIPDGYARRFTASIKFMYSGEKTISMDVDPYYAIVDHNRDNNSNSKDFTVTGTQAGMEYGTLGFAYPLPEQWTGHYADYNNHSGNGLDLNAPEGTPIYSVDTGVVAAAGGDATGSRGYFVIATNDSLDPYNDQQLHTRYLHMMGKPLVTTGQRLKWRQTMGQVGKTGQSLDPSTPVNHLHIDFNSSGYIDTTIPTDAGINPKLFYPYVDFHLDTTPRSTQPPVADCNVNLESMFGNGIYVDGVLIGLIGEENYEAWIEDTPQGEATVYKLVKDFGLSWDELQNVLHESVYTQYVQNMPADK